MVPEQLDSGTHRHTDTYTQTCKKNVNPHLLLYTKGNSNCIKEVDIKAKIVTLQEKRDKICETLSEAKILRYDILSTTHEIINQ